MRFKFLLGCLLLCGLALAHEVSFARIKLEVQANTMTALVELPLKDVALFAPELTQKADPAAIVAKILPRLALLGDGQALPPTLQSAALESPNLRLQLEYPKTSKSLEVRALLAPENALHKTFLDVYVAGQLQQQLIFDAQTTSYTVQLEQAQPLFEVIYTFVLEGIRHIFIGPDHILFIISLLLLGGTVWQILKIVSAFTLAHSVTLSLATLGLVSLPSSLIEPIIAASIVFVAGHSLLPHQRDFRIVFAFGFGLVHGFGFAGVLSELELPRTALGWALGSFNLGVEIGQVCIVLVALPLLAWVKRQPQLSHRAVVVATVAVMLTGAFWFFERVLGA
jgi:hydrogenase/urease accessory protein HupE